MITEITAEVLDTEAFIKEKVLEIQSAVKDGLAVNVLSDIVDSSTVTLFSR